MANNKYLTLLLQLARVTDNNPTPDTVNNKYSLTLLLQSALDMANKYLILLQQSALVTDNKYNLILLLQ